MWNVDFAKVIILSILPYIEKQLHRYQYPPSSVRPKSLHKPDAQGPQAELDYTLTVGLVYGWIPSYRMANNIDGSSLTHNL